MYTFPDGVRTRQEGSKSASLSAGLVAMGPMVVMPPPVPAMEPSEPMDAMLVIMPCEAWRPLRRLMVAFRGGTSGAHGAHSSRQPATPTRSFSHLLSAGAHNNQLFSWSLRGIKEHAHSYFGLPQNKRVHSHGNEQLRVSPSVRYPY